MGLDIDYIFANDAIEELSLILHNEPHGERKEIADDIIEFVEKMKSKWKHQPKTKKSSNRVFLQLSIDELEEIKKAIWIANKSITKML